MLHNHAMLFEGKSHMGKNRIKEHGNLWFPLKEQLGTSLQFAEDSDTWLLLESANTGWHRWFNTKNDKHFARVTNTRGAI